MRFKSSLLVLGIVASAFGVAQAAPVRKIVPKGATSFTSQTHLFAVWLPGKPLESRRVVSPKKGETVTEFVFSTPKESVHDVSYTVIVASNPPSVDISKPTEALETMQKRWVEYSFNHLRGREDIQLNGFQGRDLTAQMGLGPVTMRLRFYLLPKATYIIYANGFTETMQGAQKAQVDKVFDSFRILLQ